MIQSIDRSMRAERVARSLPIISHSLATERMSRWPVQVMDKVWNKEVGPAELLKILNKDK